MLEAAKLPEPQPAMLRGAPPNLPVDKSALQRDAEAALREEEKAIREMRMALREVTNTLMADARYSKMPPIESGFVMQDKPIHVTSDEWHLQVTLLLC